MVPHTKKVENFDQINHAENCFAVEVMREILDVWNGVKVRDCYPVKSATIAY